MDQYSSNKEGEAHDHFSYQQQQQQEAAAGRPFSRHASHPPQTRDWFATSAEDNTCFESSSNFMEENGGDDVRRRIDSYYNSSQTLAIEQIEKEPMFDKVVTPSDVGKLNRLVIPKQHAEKYFPLDSSANEKGLLLNFEDRTRKLWRFRYSYWNSSQSYVMTKGWSRFVKEKKLDAGDIVSFQRGVGEAFRGRLFIDWRRRPSSNPLLFHHHDPSSLSLPHRYFPFHQARSTPWETSSTPLYLRPLAQLTSGHHNYNNQSHPYNHYPYQQQQLQQGQCNNNNGVMSYNPYGVGSSSQTLLYLRSSAEESPRGDSTVFDVVHPRAERKKLRLFGVNMECDNQRSSVEESDNLSSSPTPATASPPPESPRLQDHDTTNEKSKRSMSLSLSF